MIGLIVFIYLVAIAELVRINLRKKDIEIELSFSFRTFLIGVSASSNIDENDVPFGTIQVAFLFFVLTTTYTK